MVTYIQDSKAKRLVNTILMKVFGTTIGILQWRIEFTKEMLREIFKPACQPRMV